MQPLGTTKNHGISWDKKKSRNLWGQKITQPLGQKNHATSQDKKVTLSIGPIASKLFHNALNFSKWHQFGPNWSK